MTIPLILHQIWYQGIDTIIEPYYTCFINTTKIIKINSSWSHIIWDKTKIDLFIKKEYPTYYKLYDYFEHMIQKLDIARYLILYHYGGCYMDMDIELIKDITDLIYSDDQIILSNTKQYIIDNGILFSNVKNIFWLDFINQIDTRKDNMLYKIDKTIYVEFTTGPIHFTQFVIKQQSKYKIRRLSYNIFNSRESKYDNSINKNTPNIYGINYYANSWMNPFISNMIYLYSMRYRLLLIIVIVFILTLLVLYYRKYKRNN